MWIAGRLRVILVVIKSFLVRGVAGLILPVESREVAIREGCCANRLCRGELRRLVGLEMEMLSDLLESSGERKLDVKVIG